MSLILLNETQQEIRRLARDYAQRELVPMAAERDREARFDRSMVQQMAELGFFGMLIPEQYDGLGLDAQSYLLALEEIAVGDSSAAVLLSVHNSLPTQMILNFGNEEQRTRFLPPMARGELLGAFCLSEPEAGSDAGSLATQAVREGDEWVLNGTKAWVSHGNEAGVLLCMARTDAPGAAKVARGSPPSSSRPTCRVSTSRRRKTSLGCARPRRCRSCSTTVVCPPTASWVRKGAD